MDPNNPGQNAGGPTPDPWGQPQQPGQPQYPQQPPAAPVWGAPPAGYDPNQAGAQQQPYGQPPQEPYQQPYGQQPYDPNAYGQQQPYGQQPWAQQPQWGAAPVKKSRLPRILGIVGGAVVVLIILGVVAALLLPSNAGKVIFTTDAPTSAGAKTCELGNKVTTVKLGDPVYMNIFFKDRLSGETVTLTLIKDGKTVDSIPYGTASEVNGIDCLEDYTNLADVLQQNGAGTYEFKLTDSKGNVVSDGTLTVQ